MTDDTSAALGRIKAALDYKHRHVQLTEAQAREVLAHIAELETDVRLTESERDGALKACEHMGGHIADLEARAEKLRQERDDFADMVGAELCHQPGTVTAEWDAAKRRADALAAQVAGLREALEWYAQDDGAGWRITEPNGAFVVTWSEMTQRARQALDAAPAAPETPSEDLRADKRRIDGLRELCGYVEDGSQVSVSISQDDATRDWLIRAGKRWWHGKSLRAALDAALGDARHD